MKLFKIITAPDIKLHLFAQNVTIFDERLRNFASNLIYTMQQHEGCGLASTQVEDELEFQLTATETHRAQPNVIVWQPEDQCIISVNPQILKYSRQTKFLLEGCLSFPGINNYEEVNRSTTIKVQYQTLEGEMIQLTLNNFAAQVFQHEYDHTIGKTFPDRLSKKKQQEFWEQYNHGKEQQ